MQETINNSENNQLPNPNAEQWTDMVADLEGPNGAEEVVTETAESSDNIDLGQPVYDPNHLPSNPLDSDFDANAYEEARKRYEDTGIKTLDGDQYFEDEDSPNTPTKAIATEEEVVATTPESSESSESAEPSDAPSEPSLPNDIF